MTKKPFTCVECREPLDENDAVYRSYLGPACKPCVTKMHPDHITDEDSSLETTGIEVITGLSVAMTIAIHTPTGIAAVADTEAKALMLLRKIYRDVCTVEQNERYGSIME